MTTTAVVEQLKSQVTQQPSPQALQVANIDKTIKERFEVLGLLTNACIIGEARSLIVSGAPGLGKSYTVTSMLETNDPSMSTYHITKGYILATGLYKTLYTYRHPKNVVVLDDSDAVFSNEISLGILKAVCDTTTKRIVSWKTEAKLFDDETGELLPKSFEFEGAIIFLSNINFEKISNANNKYSPHLGAMISRSHYIDLALKSRLDYLVRIIQVIKEGMLDDLEVEARQEIVQYTTKNYLKMRELSLRTVLKIRDLRAAHPDKWQRIANVTLLKV